jgi:hypothetical protein
MTSDTKKTPADILSNEKQVEAILPSLEEERAAFSAEVLSLQTADTEGVACLERIYNTYMGEFINFVRRHKGGLEPYSIHYDITKDIASPDNPHLLKVCHRNMITGEEVPVAEFAIVHVLNDSTYPIKLAPGEEPDDGMAAEMAQSLYALNEFYLEHLEENNLFRYAGSHLFYLPFITACGSLMKSAVDGPFCHETVLNPPTPLPAEKCFLPYEFFFDNEDEDRSKHYLMIRLGQRSLKSTALAVEARFSLDGLRRAILVEAATTEAAPVSRTLH